MATTDFFSMQDVGSVRSAFQGQLRTHNFITLLSSSTALLEWVAAISKCKTITRQAFSLYLFKFLGQGKKLDKRSSKILRISCFPLCHTPRKGPQFHLRREILQPPPWWCVPCRRKLHVLQAPKSSWPHQLPICEAKKSTARLARPQVRSPIIRESLFTCSLGAFIESRHFLMISSKANRNTSNMIPRLSKRDLTKTASPYVCTFGSTVLVLVKRTRTVDPKVQTYGEAFCIHDCNVSIIFCHVVVSLDSVKDAAGRHSSGTSTCKKNVDLSFSDLLHFAGMPFKNSAPWSERSPTPHMCWKCEIHHGHGCMWLCLWWLLAAGWCLFVLLTRLLVMYTQTRGSVSRTTALLIMGLHVQRTAASLGHGDLFLHVFISFLLGGLPGQSQHKSAHVFIWLWKNRSISTRHPERVVIYTAMLPQTIPDYGPLEECQCNSNKGIGKQTKDKQTNMLKCSFWNSKP